MMSWRILTEGFPRIAAKFRKLAEVAGVVGMLLVAVGVGWLFWSFVF